jgi:hypothetical protein
LLARALALLAQDNGQGKLLRSKFPEQLKQLDACEALIRLAGWHETRDGVHFELAAPVQVGASRSVPSVCCCRWLYLLPARSFFS